MDAELCAVAVKLHDVPAAIHKARLMANDAGGLRPIVIEGVAGEQPLYVFERSDWPAWQRALRRDATARYAARALPDSAQVAAGMAQAGNAPPAALLPVAPFGMLFLICMLVLWWREQLSPAATAAPFGVASGL